MSESETVNNNTEETVSTVTSTEALPEVQAAMYLHSAIPTFRSAVNSEKLTGTQAKRILEALIEHPLEKETKSFTTDFANSVYHLGLMITNAKFILFTTSLKDAKVVDEAVEISHNNINESTNNNGEESNGN